MNRINNQQRLGWLIIERSTCFGIPDTFVRIYIQAFGKESVAEK